MPKVMCKDVQVGDKLYFWPHNPDIHYLCINVKIDGEWTILNFRDSLTKKTHQTQYYQDDFWGNMFKYEPIIKKSKEELVLDKIKYLDQRWKDRKCATNIGF